MKSEDYVFIEMEKMNGGNLGQYMNAPENQNGLHES